MSRTDTAPVPPRPAATVLLLRDGAEGLEVFMVVRHRAIAFASGALVFPGGGVEPGDRAIAAALPGLGPPEAAALRIAAIRETFEECGVLLARPRGAAALLDAARLARIAAAHRAALLGGERPFAEILVAEALEPAADRLVPFAHWITPASRPKRFDTHFFLAAAPPGQIAAHDGGESVESVWIRPAKALAETERGRRKLVFATRLNLMKLARYATVGEALAAAAAEPVVTVQPESVETPAGPMLRIPVAAGYGGELFPALDPPAM
ncbi:NUDIX hydrolase [Caldovatus aquaticus]|uniref:NUDIX domain-containing protein n=1 Tax=Caldovatus aquaticus TaxID=2865671 RepID=A0ABS7F2W5_9PROT|nr:NUDIX domain-containing protein [Caldovatus aquaticus]MBW8269140.1 NUDIX domain-containing protein [Caldovatus aquaticus]